MHYIVFNATKTMCMAFKPKGMKTIEPCLTLSGNELQFVTKAKYLGVFIENNGTDADVTRQLRKFYANANILMRKFANCSDDVKCMLFKTYCTSLYCCQLWYMTSKTAMNKLRIAYNNSLRRILHIPKRSSASEMFVCLNVPSFGEILRKNIYGFIQRIKQSDNSLIASVVNSHVPLYSSVWKWWSDTLYVT